MENPWRPFSDVLPVPLLQNLDLVGFHLDLFGIGCELDGLGRASTLGKQAHASRVCLSWGRNEMARSAFPSSLYSIRRVARLFHPCGGGIASWACARVSSHAATLGGMSAFPAAHRLIRRSSHSRIAARPRCVHRSEVRHSPKRSGVIGWPRPRSDSRDERKVNPPMAGCQVAAARSCLLDPHHASRAYDERHVIRPNNCTI